MAKTHGGYSFKPRVRPSSPPPADVVAAPADVAVPACAAVPVGASAPAADQSTPPATAAAASYAPVPAAPAPRRYDTRVGPTPLFPPHSWSSQRAPPLKRARTSGSGKSSSSRPQEPYSPPVQGPADDFTTDLAPASIIRRPIFHCGPIIGNSDYSTKEVHNKTYYDFPAFTADPELRDSMRLVQRYSLEHFMTPRRFFYPQVVIEFCHTMTSR